MVQSRKCTESHKKKTVNKLCQVIVLMEQTIGEEGESGRRRQEENGRVGEEEGKKMRE